MDVLVPRRFINVVLFLWVLFWGRVVFIRWKFGNVNLKNRTNVIQSICFKQLVLHLLHGTYVVHKIRYKKTITLQYHYISIVWKFYHFSWSIIHRQTKLFIIWWYNESSLTSSSSGSRGSPFFLTLVLEEPCTEALVPIVVLLNSLLINYYIVEIKLLILSHSFRSITSECNIAVYYEA